MTVSELIEELRKAAPGQRVKLYCGETEYELGEVETGAPADGAVTLYSAPAQYMVFNETDGIYAHPDPMTAAEAEQWVLKFRQQIERYQGYYKTASGQRIEAGAVKLTLVPVEEESR